MAGLFKRIHFFKGLFMKESDWQTEQQYHIEKQRFHNRHLHTPGVVPGCLGGLRVSVSDTGKTLFVESGLAIDGEGRDLYVPQRREIIIPDLQSFSPPRTIYISIHYTEKTSDRRDNPANPMYSGDAYIAEDTAVEITAEKPDNHQRIQLGQVRLSENVVHISNSDGGGPGLPVAVKPGHPQERRSGLPASITAIPPGAIREIQPPALADIRPLDVLDLSEVPMAGAVTPGSTKGLSLSDLGDKLMDTRLVVMEGNRKQEDTAILIEQYPKTVTPPMYLVSVQSQDGVRTRWSVVSTENDEGTLDYTLHIRNESNRSTTVVCRVYRMRI